MTVPTREARRLRRIFELLVWVLLSSFLDPIRRWDVLAAILLIRAGVDLFLEIHGRLRPGARARVVLTVEVEVVETSPGIFELAREVVLPEGVRFWQR